jgi:hypothetical protein
MDPLAWTALILILVLFAALGSGIWVALALCLTAWVGLELFTGAPVGRVMGDLDLGLDLALDPRGDAAVRVDGRDPVPLAPFRGYLPRPRPLARAPAGRAPPRQHRGLRPVCRCLGLIGGDRGHRRQDVAARAQGPSLSRGQGHWHACRLGHPRLPDPALDPSDRLRRHRRTVDLPAVHRRNPARSAGGDPVHGAI